MSKALDGANEAIEGIYPAALSPLRSDLSQDHEQHMRHCRWLLANGCDGIVIHGTTGEGNSVSIAERIGTIEALGNSGILGHQIIVGTGCCALPDSIELTKAALHIGVAGVIVLPPFYFKGVSDDGLFASYSEIIQRIADERLKIYLYHFPATSGIPITIPLIERLLTAYPETVKGIKDSTGDFDNMSRIVREFPGFKVFAGTDKLLLDLLEIGGAGTISATCNVMPLQASHVFQAWKKCNSELARKHQNRLTLSCSAFDNYIMDVSRLVPALKATRERQSNNGVWQAMRPPLVPFNMTERELLFEALDRAGLDIANAP